MRGTRLWLAASILLIGRGVAAPAFLPAQTWPAAVHAAARLAPDARIVVLDLKTGRLLASAHLDQTARTLAAPGSTLKPLALYQLIDHGRWNPARRIACDRHLRIAGHAMACSHPELPPMDARQALAWSCNSYFAQVAAQLNPGELRRLLEPAGLLLPTGLAPAEAPSTLRDPQTPDQNRLAVLGVEGIRVTPLALAYAYRWLALQFAAHPASPATAAVRAGLTDSASYGMAQAAGQGPVPVMGKTGTAEGASTSQTHGWFAGIAPADGPEVVIVVYLPAGRGADAALVAAELLAHSPVPR